MKRNINTSKYDMHNVVTKIVKKGLCSGCGICAGIKPECLKITFNKWGELIPKVSLCNNCGICLSLCPFSNENLKTQTSSPLGTFIENYVGYSNSGEERKASSSGGLATRVLRALLDNKMVDGVVAVGFSKTKDRLFEPIIIRDSKELNKVAGSKYYPIEFSSVIRTLREHDGEYAFVGLPCVISALRLVKQKQPLYSKKIKYLLGLACGHNKNTNYTSFLLNLAESDKKDIETVEYRIKNTAGWANNYGFRGILKKNEGRTKQLNFVDSLVAPIWCGYYFSLSSCLHCKDLFAQDADITFMDAWLEPYIKDPKGTSIVVVRDANLKKLLESETNQENVTIDTISLENVILSQKGAYLIKNKNISKKIAFLFNRWISNRLFSDMKVRTALGKQGLILYMTVSQKAAMVIKKIRYLLSAFKKTLVFNHRRRGKL